MKLSKTTTKGFTIIETLVAITILMISIAGPLTIAHKSFMAAIQARDQLTASYLAQDAMEYIKHIRDDNMLNASNWLAHLDACIAQKCAIDTLTGAVIAGITTFSLTKTQNGYGHSGGTPTPFSRSFSITKIHDNQARVTVEVRWTGITRDNLVTYTSELFNVMK